MRSRRDDVQGALDRENLSALLQEALFDVGDLKPTVRRLASPGWLMCDGTAVSRTVYVDLWNEIRSGHAGTGGDPAPFGNGDGSTTFNLPDLRGRAPVGAGQGAGLTLRNLGAAFGEETHQLTINELAAHIHEIVLVNSTGGAPQAAASAGGGDELQNTDSVGGNVAHNNMQPSLTLNWLVKV